MLVREAVSAGDGSGVTAIGGDATTVAVPPGHGDHRGRRGRLRPRAETVKELLSATFRLQ